MKLTIVQHPITVGINRRATRDCAVKDESSGALVYNKYAPSLNFPGNTCGIPAFFYSVEAEKFIKRVMNEKIIL